VDVPSFVPLPPKRVKRGGPLHWLLLLLSLATAGGGLAGVFSVAAGNVEDTLGPSALPRRVLILSVFGLMNVCFAFAVWGWRRWGVYGVVVVSLFAFMENWRIGGAVLALPGIGACGVLVLVASLAWAEFD
jgi:hypothetical protein